VDRTKVVLTFAPLVAVMIGHPRAFSDHAPCRHNDSVAGQVFPVRESALQVVRQSLDIALDDHPEQVKLEGDKHWSDHCRCFGIGGRRMFSAPRAAVVATYVMRNPTRSRIEREMAFPFTGKIATVRIGGRPSDRTGAKEVAGDAWLDLGYQVTCDDVPVPARVVSIGSTDRKQANARAADVDEPRVTEGIASQWGYDGQFLDPDSGRLYPRGSLLPGWRRYRPNRVKAPLAWSDEATPKPTKAPHRLGFLRYRLTFDPGQERTVTVRYRTLTDYDTVIDQLCCRPMIAQFCYLLKPVRYWSSFGPIEVSLSAPRGFRVVANFEGWSRKEAGDRVVYSTRLRKPQVNLHVALYHGISPLADFLLYSLRGGCPSTRGADARQEALVTLERTYWRLAEDRSLRLSLREAALKQLKKAYAACGGEPAQRKKVTAMLRQILMMRLAAADAQAGPHGRATFLTKAILDADGPQAIARLASLARPQDRAHLCGAFESLARAWNGSVYFQTGSFSSLRNSIHAYGIIDRERAVAFYRSLLRSEKRPQREIGVYGLGDLRVGDAVDDLLAVAVPTQENRLCPGSVCVALGKIGTPEADDALVRMLLEEPIVVRRSWSALVVMTEICGLPGGSPRGCWENGFWATVADDRLAAAKRFSQAMKELAETSGDERLSREASSRAGWIVTRTKEALGRK